MAIDRSALGKVLHRDMVAADSLLQSEIFPAGKGMAPAYDPVAAKKVLTEALGDTATIPAIECLTYSSDETALIAQFVLDQLHKNLGLHTTISMPEYSMYRAQLQLQSSAMFFRCWAADYADPDTYFEIFKSNSGNSFTGWKNAAYDELIRKGASTPNGTERTRIYKDALELLLRKEATIDPLYFDNLTFLLGARVKHFSINPLNYVFFRDITLE
jgi:oligopeptide transport system substrate-binding protein